MFIQVYIYQYSVLAYTPSDTAFQKTDFQRTARLRFGLIGCTSAHRWATLAPSLQPFGASRPASDERTRFMTRHNKHKRPKKTAETKHRSDSSPFLRLVYECWETILKNRETVLLVVVILHLLFFLVFVAALISARGPAPSTVFGQSPAPLMPGVKTTEKAPTTKPISPTSAWTYSISTVLLWGWLIASFRRLSGRQGRVMAMLLIPGTLMAIYSVVHALIAPS